MIVNCDPTVQGMLRVCCDALWCAKYRCIRVHVRECVKVVLFLYRSSARSSSVFQVYFVIFRILYIHPTCIVCTRLCWSTAGDTVGAFSRKFFVTSK